MVKNGYKVNLIQFEDNNLNKNKSTLEKNYNLIQIPYPLYIKALFYVFKVSFRFLKIFGSQRINTFGDGFVYILNTIYFIFYSYFKFDKNVKQVFITGDPPGNIAAHFLTKNTENKIIFWSLELFLKKELQDWGMRLVKRFEKKFSKNIDCVVEFGEIRAKLIKEENCIPNDIPTYIIPNSRLGKPRVSRSFYFNKLFNISVDKKIILYSGGIYGDYNNTNILIKSAYSWQEDYVLVLHAKKKQDLANKITIDWDKAAGKIFFDDSPVAFDEIDKIYSSADIGLVINSPNSRWFYSNHYYAQLSLGKLFHFAFNGIPVITKNLFGYEQLVEQNGIGYSIEKIKDIECSISKILEDKKKFEYNCIIFSHNYAFEERHKQLINFLAEYFT
ncbi:MAG: hypothetical protein STSR0008_12130 [Ignavibacterium sp.]